MEQLVLDRTHRLLLQRGRGLVTALDPVTGEHRATRTVPLRQASLGVTDDGTIWLSGQFEGPAVVRLDPATLETAGQLPGWPALQRPVRLAGGRAALLLALPDGALGCARSGDGAGLERWPAGTVSADAEGEGSATVVVASAPGDQLLALHATDLVVLPLRRCPG